MSETPRTDAFLEASPFVSNNFARELETELTAANARIAELEAKLQFPDIGKDPLKLVGEERSEYRDQEAVLARLRKGVSKQQREVPDQTTLVWRADLGWLIHQFAWREAGHKNALAQIARLKAEGAVYRSAIEQGLESLRSFISDSSDPGTGALSAEYMMDEALKSIPAPTDREVRGD